MSRRREISNSSALSACSGPLAGQAPGVELLPGLPVARLGGRWHLVAGSSTVPVDEPLLAGDLERLLARSGVVLVTEGV